MEVKLPQEKVLGIKQQCQELLHHTQTTVRVLAKVIGKLTAAIRAILPGPLHYRQLQMQKARALLTGNQSYESVVILTPECKAELDWWVRCIDQWNGRTMIRPSPDLAVRITTDASKKGWGAVWQDQTTQGVWSEEEQLQHINVLELKSAYYALKAFTKQMTDVHVHLRVDNMSTVSQINKMGGPRSGQLLEVTQQLWDYCLSKKIMLTAEHLPGHLNQVADTQSRIYEDSSNWQLMPEVFKQLDKRWGPFQIDWFADRLNAQVRKFVSWKPDPEAWQVDAFTMPWQEELGYAFPPFCLIGRCLAKVQRDSAEMVLVTPVWQTQPWFPRVLGMLTDFPVLLPQAPNLLTGPTGKTHPLTQGQQIWLAAWRISGNSGEQQGFQNKLQECWRMPGDQGLNPLTIAPGENMLAGVLKGKLIHFSPLWQT